MISTNNNRPGMRLRNEMLWGILLIASMSAPPVLAAEPCCAITQVDTRTGVVTAQVVPNGPVFQFRVVNQAMLSSVRVGEKIYANFTTRQVSLDGKTACCTIVSLGPAQPAPAAPPARPVVPPQPGSAQPSSALRHPTAPRAPVAEAARVPKPLVPMNLPSIAFGAPIPVSQGGVRGRLAAPSAALNTHMLHLRGTEEIKNAPIHEGARNLLLMHALQLPPDQVDHYVVDPQLAEQWMKTRPVPASAKSGDSHAGCHKLSMHCLGEAAKHTEDEAARQSEKLRQQAQVEWKHVAQEAAHDWNATEACFADQTLRAQDVPVRFTLPIQFPLSFEKEGKRDLSHGSASGQVKGTLTVGLPVDADFKAHAEMFYVPCLPFAFRPKTLGADGNLTVSTNLGAMLTATGQFSELFPIPPSGGPHFPIEVIPIVIAGVPVAEMDVSIYVDGSVAVDANGEFDGQFKLNAPHQMAFDFDCDGGGCHGSSHNVPVPATTSEDVKVTGRVHVKPAIYTALQLDFDVSLLTARAGPQPYLWGELYGCAAGSATQSTAAPTTAQTQYALTADVDWGIELRAEALAANKKLGGFTRDVFNPPHRHIWFRDLANSTALLAALQGATQVGANRPAVFNVTMPQCYPYTDPVEYSLQWTGGAVAASRPLANKNVAATAVKTLSGSPSTASSSSSCNLQSGAGDCWGDPVQPTSFDLVWPGAGSFTLQATPVRDKHGREFPQKPTQVQVSVQP